MILQIVVRERGGGGETRILLPLAENQASSQHTDLLLQIVERERERESSFLLLKTLNSKPKTQNPKP
jgi:hypothetical protein